MKFFAALFLRVIIALLTLSSPLIAAELNLPQFVPLDLVSFLPVIHGQIPANQVIMSSQAIPAWKLSWDQARVLARQEDSTATITKYKEVLAQKDNLIQARWELALLFMQQEDWHQAVEQVGHLLAADPDNKLYTLVKAVLIQKNGEFSHSLDLFKRGAGATGLDDPLVVSGMVNALYALGKDEECLALLTNLLRYNPENDRLILDFTLLAFRLKRYDLAQKYIAQLASQKDSAPFLLLAARVYVELGQVQEAVGYWQQLLALRPGNIEACEYLAQYYENHGVAGGAISCLLVLLEQRSQTSIYQKRVGLAYLKAGQFDKALPYLEQYLLENPNDIDSVRAMIKIQAAKGEKDATLATLEHYFSIESRPAKGNLQQAAQLYSEGGFFQEAIPIYRRLLDMTPNDPKFMWALAQTLLASGNEEEALTAWQELAGVAPGAIEVYRPIAALLERLGRKRELLEVLTIINGLDPTGQTVIFKLAGLHFARHEFSKAMFFLDQFIGPQRQRREFFRWRGTIWLQRGELAKALQDFEALLEIAPALDDIRLQCVWLAGLVDNLQAVKRHVAYLGHPAKKLARLTKIIMARAFFDSGDFARAEELYRDVVEGLTAKKMIGGKNEIVFAAFKGLAELLTVEGLPYEAEEVLRQGVALNGDSRFINELFKLALGKGKFIEAKGWLDLLLRSSTGGEWNTLMAQARYLISQGKGALTKSLNQGLLSLLKEGWSSDGWQGEGGLLGGYYSLSDRHVFELIDLNISLQHYEEAVELCRTVLAGDSTKLAAGVLENIIYEESGGQFGRKFLIQYADMSPSLFLAYEKFCWQHQMLAELVRVTTYIREISPHSLRSALFLAAVKVKLGQLDEAILLYKELLSENPGRQDILAVLAKLYFGRGHVDSSKEIVAQLQGVASRGDIVLLKARIAWLKHDWQQSIAIYEDYLHLSLEDLLNSSATTYNVTLPEVDDDRSFLEQIGLSPYSTSGLVDKVMEPEFIGWLTAESPELGQAIARLYARYCWQKKFAGELRIRRAVNGREYVLAAKEYELFIKKNPHDSHLLYDLAGVYSRLGRLGDEAALYEQLRTRDVDYPGLEDTINRNHLKQRPFVTAEYGYLQEEGWQDQKNIRQNWLATSMRYSLGTQQSLEASVSVLNYESTTIDETIRAQQIFTSYKSSIWHGVTMDIGAGLHNQADGDDVFLFKGGVTGKFGDKLSGRVSLARDIVADSLTSIAWGVVQNRLDAGIMLDIVPRLELSGDYSYIDYSDANWTTGYELQAVYILFSEPTFLKVNYSFDFKDSEYTSNVDKSSSHDFQPGDHPYWAPKNYWKNSFGVFFKHTFGNNTLERQAPRYYTAEYYVGHYSDGYSFQTLNLAGFIEFNTSFFAKIGGEISSSHPYTKKELVLSISYRW